MRLALGSVCLITTYADCAGRAHVRLDTMISVTASELIHSTQLVARTRSAKPSAVPVSEAMLSSMKQSGQITRAAVIMGTMGRQAGSRSSRLRSWAGVNTSTRKAAVATVASVIPPGL